MPLILNIESGTEICSVALAKDGQVLSLKENKEGNMHSSVMTLLIEELFNETGIAMKEIDAVAISKGPGSYTGLRVGTSTAKGICFALDLPLLAVDSLQAIAYGMKLKSDDEGIYLPMIDARRMEVYTNMYDQDLNPLQTPEAKIIEENSFDHLLKHGERLILGGNGAEKCKNVLKSPYLSFTMVRSSAANMTLLAEKAFSANKMEQIGPFSPFYLKGANVTRSKKKLF
jgi:tRNA threonylcarbamoyladenosine biosynthesis protein TsaB